MGNFGGVPRSMQTEDSVTDSGFTVAKKGLKNLRIRSMIESGQGRFDGISCRSTQVVEERQIGDLAVGQLRRLQAHQLLVHFCERLRIVQIAQI